MKNKGIIIISILILFISCQSESEFLGRKVTVIKDSNFKEISLKSKSLDYIENKLIRPTDLLIMDSLIIVVDGKSEKPLHAIDTKNKNYIGQYINKGKGPNELDAPWRLSKINQSSFLITDIFQRKYLGFTINDLLTTSVPFEEKKIVQTGRVNSLFYDKLNSKMFYIGNFPEDYRLYEKNLISGNIKGHASLLTATNGSNAIEVKNHISHALASVNKDYSLFAFSYIHSPLIETLNVTTGELKTVIIPERTEPIYESRVREGITEVGMTSESLITFPNIKISNKYIYALYSGRKLGDNELKKSTIYVFDQELNPIKKINLDAKINSFDVKNDSLIYGLDLDTDIYPKILSYTLN